MIFQCQSEPRNALRCQLIMGGQENGGSRGRTSQGRRTVALGNDWGCSCRSAPGLKVLNTGRGTLYKRFMLRFFLITALCAVPTYAADLQSGQIVSSGDRGCQFDALPIPGALAVYDHSGKLIHFDPPSPGA